MEARIQPLARDKGMPEAVAGLKHELERRGIDLIYCATALRPSRFCSCASRPGRR